MFQRITIAILTVLCLSACKVPEEQFPVEPVLTFASFSKESVARLETFQIVMNFTDGDGDIGVSGTNPDWKDTLCVTPDSIILKNPNFNLFYRDLRDSCVQYVSTGYYKPEKANESIRGEVVVEITASCKKVCASQPCIDTAIYEFKLRDRAGHYSEWTKTSGIVVTGCQ